MPRAPIKRRLPNRYGPISRATKPIPNSSPAKRELEKKLAHKAVGPRPDDSDDSDGLVVRGRGRRGRNVPKQEIYASGAVGNGDKPGSYPSRAQRRKNMLDATKEILAQSREDARREGGSVSDNGAQSSPLVNGTSRQAKDAKPDTSKRPIISSSATKPPTSILRSAQPTPARENTILGALKPRRRQPSILRNLDHDSSTFDQSSFDLDNEDDFLPDAESTPVHLSKPHNTILTPATKSSQLPSSRKRKRDTLDPFQPDKENIVQAQTTSPLTTGLDAEATPEPSLPAVPLSTLRVSGRKQRERTSHQDDVMALPESSSSPSATPVQMKAAATRKKRKPTTKPAPVMTTEELQALMMPTKRRRTARGRTQARGEFDIPADSQSEDPGSDQNDESSFMPTQRKRKPRQKGLLANTSKGQRKAGRGGAQAATTRPSATYATGAAKTKRKPSTKHLITTTAPPPAPSTTTSSTRRDRETKSPSQLSSVEFSTIHNQMANKVRGQQRRYGGSLRRGKGSVDGPDKENQDIPDIDLEEVAIEHPEGEDQSPAPPSAYRPRKTGGDKWADIDAWDMDFEDVEVMTGSGDSSPMRR